MFMSITLELIFLKAQRNPHGVSVHMCANTLWNMGGVAIKLQLRSVLSACRINVSLRQARSTSCRWFQTIVSSHV